jgi:hypothetical protein
MALLLCASFTVIVEVADRQRLQGWRIPDFTVSMVAGHRLLDIVLMRINAARLGVNSPKK